MKYIHRPQLLLMITSLCVVMDDELVTHRRSIPTYVIPIAKTAFVDTVPVTVLFSHLGCSFLSGFPRRVLHLWFSTRLALVRMLVEHSPSVASDEKVSERTFQW